MSNVAQESDIGNRVATPEAIELYCKRSTNVANANFRQRGDTVNSLRFFPSSGGRVYVRIVQESIVHGTPCSRSAHLFVKLTDGTLWKPDGWKGPAKNFPRGSVFDVPAMPRVGYTMDLIRDEMIQGGSHWFDEDTMRFFRTRLSGTVYQGPGGIYFVTSEKPPHGPRAHSVRQYRPADRKIDTVGEFCSMTRSQAIALAKRSALG